MPRLVLELSGNRRKIIIWRPEWEPAITLPILDDDPVVWSYANSRVILGTTEGLLGIAIERDWHPPEGYGLARGPHHVLKPGQTLRLST